jgi:hypothetical protein
MKAYSLVVSALAIGLSLPAMAQQSMHRYVAFFNYSETAVKAMTETPQDRAAQAAELAESFGRKLEAAYWFPAGSERWNGHLDISRRRERSGAGSVRQSYWQFNEDQTASLMTGEEFKAAMEKAKNVKTSYTPPTSTKQ